MANKNFCLAKMSNAVIVYVTFNVKYYQAELKVICPFNKEEIKNKNKLLFTV